MNILKILLIAKLIFVLGISFAQQPITGYSSKKYVFISKTPPKPPKLIIDTSSVKFIDENKNGILDADEQSALVFHLKNTGQGPGLNLKVKIINTNQNIILNKISDIGVLKKNGDRQIEIPLTATTKLLDGMTSFLIQVIEANGFNSNKIEVNLKTKSFQAPLVKVVDYKVSSNKFSTLQKGEPFTLQVLIQNIDKGEAKNISVILPLPNGIYCLTDNDYFIIERLKGGEKYLVEYSLIVSSSYSSLSIPIEIQLSEKFGKYSKNKNITLEMAQEIATSQIIVNGSVVANKDIKIASLSSDIDKNIPLINKSNPNRLALIIGNENYNQFQHMDINVDFAKNDASVFRQYAKNIFGVKEKNIYYLLDATSGQMNRTINIVSSILTRLGDKGELIFYYAGHGFPDQQSNTPYLIPVDVDANNLDLAIRLSDLYEKLGKTNASKITLFIDACFSGGGRTNNLLTSRSILIKPKYEPIKGNMIVFSAAKGNQIALPYSEEKHGLFTYFLLKKLKESKGEISYGELASFLENSIGIESLRINGKEQDPVIQSSPMLKDKWKKWKIN